MGKIRDVYPSFIKLLNEDDLGNKIRVPQAFVKRYKQKIPKKCLLKRIGGGGRAKSWPVRIRRRGDEHFICRQAWPKFVKDHHLKHGDYLVFRLVEKSTFQVMHYGPDCCLKPHALLKDYSDSDSDSDSNSGSDDAGESDSFRKESEYEAETADEEEEKNDELSSEQDDPKSKERKTTSNNDISSEENGPKSRKRRITRLPSTPRRTMQSNMKKRPVNFGSRKIKTEDSMGGEFIDGYFNYEAKNPYFIVTLKKQHMLRYMHIPRSFANKTWLGREQHIKLHGEDEREWSIRIYNKGMHVEMRTGWADFRRGYQLKVGDTCGFTLLTQLGKAVLVEIVRG